MGATTTVMKRITKAERQELKNALRTAEANVKSAKKAYRKATRGGRLIVVALIVCLCTILCAMAFADDVPPEEVAAMKDIIQKSDVAVLPEGAVLGNVNEPPCPYEYSHAAWVEGDNERILFFALNLSGFDAVANANEGTEVYKYQECLITTTSGDQIECTAPDGAIYSLYNEYGMELGETAVICFLLSAPNT